MIQAEEIVPLRDPQTASRLIDGEVVIVDPRSNIVRMLNSVGSRIWELADGTRRASEIAAILVEEFDVTPDVAGDSVKQFITELQEMGLLIRR